MSCLYCKPGIIFPYVGSSEIALVAILVKLLKLTHESEVKETLSLNRIPSRHFLTALTELKLNLVIAQETCFDTGLNNLKFFSDGNVGLQMKREVSL